MRASRINLLIFALLTLQMSHSAATAQFSWDGDCGFNWADCCNYGTEQNPEWRNNWTIAPNFTNCPNLPGSEDNVSTANIVLLAQPYQTAVKSLTVNGTFILKSELDIADYFTISSLSTVLFQNGPTATLELHGETAFAEIASFATLDFQFDGSISGPPGGQLINNGLILKSVGGEDSGWGEVLSALNIPWENNNTITATDGKLVFYQGGSNNGIIEANGEAEIRFVGPADFLLDGEVRGDGLIRFASTYVGGAATITGDYHPTNTLVAGGYATVNFEVDTSIENLTIGNTGIVGGTANLNIDDLLWNGGYSTFAPGGTTIVQDTMLIQHDSFAGGYFAISRDMELHGDSVLESAQVYIDDGELRNYGDLQMRGTATISQACCTPDALIQNFGSFRKTSGAQSVINVVFLNLGEVAVESGALNFDSEVTNDAMITVNAGTTLYMGHKLQTNFLSGSITGEGEVFFYNDFYSGDETVDSMLGAYDVGSTTIQAGSVSFETDGIIATEKTTGTLNLIQGFGATKLLGNADLIVTDQFNWASGEMAGTGTTYVHGPMMLNNVGYWQSLSRTLELNVDAPPSKLPPTSTLSIDPLGTLHCRDVTIDGHVYNNGLISPGTPTAPVGQLHLTGGYTQTSGGQLSVNSLGPAHDELIVDGVATLNGILNVNGFASGGGQSYTILTAAGINGTFTQVNAPAGMQVVYAATSVTLQAAPGTPCPADIEPQPYGNSVVDVDDLLALINDWGTCKACLADIAPRVEGGDGVVDVDDLLELINNWGPCD